MISRVPTTSKKKRRLPGQEANLKLPSRGGIEIGVH